MIKRFEAAIEKNRLLNNGSSVIAALSGGADSVTLLHLLISVKEKYNLKIYAAHLNHQIRGEEAERDEDFCKILCKNYNIELFIRRENIPLLAKQRKISEELCGRQERYRFFEELSRKLGAKTATAHNADDNAETLLFNLARGTSLKGASGIPVKRGNIIRPLLSFSRDDIENYCREQGLDYVIDSTNLSDDYTRNKIRHGVIPELKALNPDFVSAAARFCESAKRASDYIEAQAKKALENAKTEFGYSAKTLVLNDEAVLDEAISVLCRQNGALYEYRHILLVKDILYNGGAVCLGGATAVCKQSIFRFEKNDTETEPLNLSFNSAVSFDYNRKHVEAIINKSETNLVFRNRKSGDSFTFFKRNITKPLRKALTEQKIPGSQRDNLILLCSDSTVLWCEYLGFSKQGEALRQQKNLTINVSQNKI